jgi:hypothetical protein
MRLHNDIAERRQQPRGLDGTAPPRPQLVSMIPGAFREMPGLCLHGNQAARLFGLPLTTCRLVLDDLVQQGKLRRSYDGQYLGAQLDSAPMREAPSSYLQSSGDMAR